MMRYIYPVRVLVNFEQHGELWSTHCISVDCRTPVSGNLEIRGRSTLLQLFRACGATDPAIREAEIDMKLWGRGGIWIFVPEHRHHLLRICPTFV